MKEEEEIARLIWLRDNRELSYDQVYDLYLRSKYWKRIRKLVLLRDYRQCVRCRAAINLQVHHKKYGEMGEEDFDQLETLCVHCHAAETERVDLLAGVQFQGRDVVVKDGQLFRMLRVK
jgi:hypothetical protein